MTERNTNLALLAVLVLALIPTLSAGQEACGIRALDLTYEAPAMIASGILEGDCPREVFLTQLVRDEPFFEGWFETREDGRFIVEMPAPPEPDGEPLALSLGARAHGGEARLEAFFGRDPDGMPAVAPIPDELPELTMELTGTWALTVRDRRSGHVNGLDIARVEQAGNRLTFFDKCRPDSVLAHARLEGERITLLDPETERVMARGQVGPGHILAVRSEEEAPVVPILDPVILDPAILDTPSLDPAILDPAILDPAIFDTPSLDPSIDFEEVERVVELEAVRIEDMDCDDRAAISFATPYRMHMDEGFAQSFSLNPWAGYLRPIGLQFIDPEELKYRNGMDHLRAAAGRWFDLPKTSASGPTGAKTTTCSETSAGGFAPKTCPASGSGHTGYMECTTQGWRESDIVDLAERVALVSDPFIYPGALLQGADLGSRAFTPITLPRSGGTLSLHGVDLSNSAIRVKTQVSEITPANVRQAQHSLLGNAPKPNAAFSWISKNVYSFEHLMLSLGAHIKWPSGNLKASFSFNTTHKENHVLVKFTQRMYEIVYQPPAQPQLAFKEGSLFHDPWSQIGRGNRPVYVGKVAYGRQLFLLVKSKHTHEEIKAGLDLAFIGQSATGNTKYSKILDESSFTYIAFGGDVETAAGPLKQLSTNQSAGAAFKAVASTAANVKALTAAGTAEPIAFSLYDLITNRPAQLGYTVAYNQRSCRVVSPHGFNYQLKVDKVDDDVKVWVGQEIAAQVALHADHIDTKRRHWGWSAPRTFDLNPHINRLNRSGGDVKLIVRQGNGGCFETYADIKLLLDGQIKWKYHRPNRGWSHCGWHSHAEIWVNPRTGIVSVAKDQR